MIICDIIDVETPLEYILSYEFTKETLEEGKKVLFEVENRPVSYYKDKIMMKFDRKEMAHYRNVINYWEKRLNETQSS